jgi:ribonucleotide monophosphatase NagD (HAD superfamily)
LGGKLSLAPGALAENYAILGGRIITLGKPDVRIMQYALEGIVKDDNIVIIGDNVATDIKCASLMGFDSILISKGRHVNFLGEGYIPDITKTRELSNSYDVSPSFVISALRW